MKPSDRPQILLFLFPFLGNLFIILEAMERVHFHPTITHKWTRFEIQIKPFLVGGLYGVLHLPFVFFILNGRGSQSLDELETIARQRRFPRLDCANLHMGQPDIVGPGVFLCSLVSL